jgi:hypothetical protein
LPARLAGGLEELVADGFERGHDPGDDLGVIAQVQIRGTVGVVPRAQTPPFMDATPPLFGVARVGLGASALVP